MMRRDRSFEVHFGWGLAVSLALSLFGVPPYGAFIGAVGAGIAVELVQWRWPVTGTATIEDAIYIGLGGAVGAIVAVVSYAI